MMPPVTGDMRLVTTWPNFWTKGNKTSSKLKSTPMKYSRKLRNPKTVVRITSASPRPRPRSFRRRLPCRTRTKPKNRKDQAVLEAMGM